MSSSTPSTRTTRIEDYAVIGNCETMALVRRDGSIDWLGMPCFDSAACFAALLGTQEHGRWKIAPTSDDARVTRQYRPATLILETEFVTATGTVRLVDCMMRRDNISDVVRLVVGVRGCVEMHVDLAARFEYGSRIPWVSRMEDGRLQLTAGAERLVLDTAVALEGDGMRTVGTFTVTAGQEVGFSLSWSPSFHAVPPPLKPQDALAQAETFWVNWAKSFQRSGPWSDQVLRSLLTLKALTHWQTGGIVAAGTTSLPEWVGGPRNWDYRLCWLRDSTFTLYALIGAGFLGEALAWRAWLLRAIAGSPKDLQIMYGVAGESRLTEYEVPWLPGYEGSTPVRIGNAAAAQIQLDIYGEILDTLYVARKAGLAADDASWRLECALIERLEMIWQEPDNGIWEVRGGRRHFTHSKVMAWVAFDRAVRSAEEFGLAAPVAHWREIRDRVHAQVCERGFDPVQNSFVQSYGDTALDAATLAIPMVGFLPADDPRVRGTVAAIERDLVRNRLVMRYNTSGPVDGLPPGEGSFLACSFWLADNYVLAGRMDEACDLFAHLLSLCNDVGLLAEEYDPVAQRQLGNFPQALSHLGLINTAHNIASVAGPAHVRSGAQERK